MQCKTISLTNKIPAKSQCSGFPWKGTFHWENPNPDSCFYLKAANSLLKQKKPTLCKIKKKIKKPPCKKASKPVATKPWDGLQERHFSGIGDRIGRNYEPCDGY